MASIGETFSRNRPLGLPQKLSRPTGDSTIQEWSSQDRVYQRICALGRTRVLEVLRETGYLRRVRDRGFAVDYLLQLVSGFTGETGPTAKIESPTSKQPESKKTDRHKTSQNRKARQKEGSDWPKPERKKGRFQGVISVAFGLGLLATSENPSPVEVTIIYRCSGPQQRDQPSEILQEAENVKQAIQRLQKALWRLGAAANVKLTTEGVPTSIEARRPE